MNFQKCRVTPLLAGALLAFSQLAFPLSAQSQELPAALCANGECEPAITGVEFQGRSAYRLTDGKSAAIIVPEIGRVMSFGKVGGPNLLWNLEKAPPAHAGWTNYGGDKTWLAPQSSWQQFHGKTRWPPDEAFDGKPHRAEVLSGGKVRLISPLSVSGIRLTREMYFDARGDFVIEQTARKERGAALEASIWSITQTVPGAAIFLPISLNSTYTDGYFQFDKPQTAQKVVRVKPNLLRITPVSAGGGFKVGTDAPVSSLASVRDGVAFVQKTAQPKGKYADAQNGGAGLPIEVFVLGDPKSYFVELELFGPLKTFKVGGKSTQIVRWSLHDLPSKDADSPLVADAVEKLLHSS